MKVGQPEWWKTAWSDGKARNPAWFAMEVGVDREGSGASGAIWIWMQM